MSSVMEIMSLSPKAREMYQSRSLKRIQRPCLINCRCDGAFGHHSPSGRSRVAESEQAEASRGKNFAVGEDTDKNDSQDVP